MIKRIFAAFVLVAIMATTAYSTAFHSDGGRRFTNAASLIEVETPRPVGVVRIKCLDNDAYFVWRPLADGSTDGAALGDTIQMTVSTPYTFESTRPNTGFYIVRTAGATGVDASWRAQ